MQFDSKIVSMFKKSIINLEIDILVLSKNCLLIVEVKSNPNDVFKAMDQLKKFEHVITKVFESICHKEVTVTKVVAIPEFKHPFLKKKAGEQNVQILMSSEGRDEMAPKLLSEIIKLENLTSGTVFSHWSLVPMLKH